MSISSSDGVVLACMPKALDGDTTAFLRGLPNQSAREVTICKPWEFKGDIIPAHLQGDKAAYKLWAAEASTQHLFITGSEGTNPDLRVNRNNPLRYLHALIADYDVPMTQAMEDNWLSVGAADQPPNWICTTFSGGRRLVWLFEEKVLMDCPELTKQFLWIAAKELHVKSILPGWDEPAWRDLSKFYERASGWKQIKRSPLSKSFVYEMLFEASQKTDWSAQGITIPLDKVAEEVEQQYPGVWDGDFVVGARGCVFWEGRSNPTAAIVTENGMIAFSSHKVFHSWAEVLGKKFVSQYEADKISKAIDGVWYDGSTYYRKIGGEWRDEKAHDFMQWLSAKQGLDSSKGKHETASEAAHAAVFVREHRRVDAFAPFVFDRRDTIVLDHVKFLNSARVKPMQPAETPQTWGTAFPWIARFLELRFTSVEREYFLGWWKTLYCSALQGEPRKGHALFIAGKVSTGKTLLSNKMIGASVGGCADVSEYAVKGGQFNKEAMEKALWAIDDGEVASDVESHRRFSERIKKTVANPMQPYRAMYKDSVTIPWYGRVVVTLNVDPQSVQMIPDLAASMEEKVMVLKFTDKPYSFPKQRELENMIVSELPYFLRWLVDWPMPEHIRGEERLGVKSYVNQEVRALAMQAGQVGDLLDVVQLWITRSTFHPHAQRNASVVAICDGHRRIVQIWYLHENHSFPYDPISIDVCGLLGLPNG